MTLKKIVPILLTLLLCIFTLKIYITNRAVTGSLDSGSWNIELAEYIRQRNNISTLLNLKQQQIGQMECENFTDNNDAASTSGGWCAKRSAENGGRHRTDLKIIPTLVNLFTGTCVASFGDGPGRYKQLFLETGKLKCYDAYDGAPFSETTSEGRVQFLDLTLPQYGLPVYDWIISLEVAEHIPMQYERTFIDNIVRHTKVGVVLSWAKPGQDGYFHVNNRPFDYILKLMESQGFKHDEVESWKLRKAASLSWLKNNTHVYRRKHLDKDEETKLLLNA